MILLLLNGALFYFYFSRRTFSHPRYDHQEYQSFFYVKTGISGPINCDTNERQGVGTSVTEKGEILVVLNSPEEKVLSCTAKDGRNIIF